MASLLWLLTKEGLLFNRPEIPAFLLNSLNCQLVVSVNCTSEKRGPCAGQLVSRAGLYKEVQGDEF